MSISVTRSNGAASASPFRNKNEAERRQAMFELTKDIHAGNLDGAKQAYTTLTKNVPASVLANPDSALGQLGSALQAGDADAAKVALAKVAVKMHDIRDARASGGASADPIPAPVGSATNTSGSLFHIVV